LWQVAIVNGAFEDRFDPNTYANDEPVVITWTDHTWGVPESLFVRMQHLAKAYGLYLLASVDYYRVTRLNGQQCVRLTDELLFIKKTIQDPTLHPHLDACISLALACARGTPAADLIVEGP